MKRAWSTLLLAGVGGAWMLSSCGPSMQSIHEGNVRFEHCYRLDLDPAITPSHRQACWREWTERHTFGQSGDRIGYARRRAHEIAGGKTGIELALDAGTAPVPADGAEPAPAPASLYTPPPPVTPTARPVVDAAAPASSTVAPPPVPLPAADCSEACQTGFRACQDRCADAAQDSCPKCARDYRTCMRRCFK